MIDFIMTLVRSYRQATGEHPDRIVCSYAVLREIVATFDAGVLDAIIHDAAVDLCGLQVVAKHDVHPGLIMVCRANDESKYATGD